MFCGSGHEAKASISSGSVSTPFWLTTWPRYLTLGLKNSHFEPFNFKPCWFKRQKTASNRSTCSLNDSENIRLSTRNMRHSFKLRSPIHPSINLWNVARAFVKPKAIRLHSWKPKFRILKAVSICLSHSFQLASIHCASQVLKNISHQWVYPLYYLCVVTCMRL